MARRLLANPVQQLKERFKVAAFTDGGGTSGFKDFAGKLPAGCIIIGWRATIRKGFAGDTTAVINVGKSGAVGNYSTAATASVFTDATSKNMSAPVATNFEDALTTPRVTVTTGTDFTLAVTNGLGDMDVTLFYVNTNAKPI